MKQFCSPDVFEMVFYLRALFLVRIGEHENVENLDKADLRNQLLKAGEEQLRQSLAKFAFNYEVQSVQNDIVECAERISETRESDVQRLRDSLTAVFESAAIPAKDRKGLYENTEEHMCFADRQSQTLSNMLRARSLLGHIFKKKGMLLESFYILRQGL